MVVGLRTAPTCKTNATGGSCRSTTAAQKLKGWFCQNMDVRYTHITICNFIYNVKGVIYSIRYIICKMTCSMNTKQGIFNRLLYIYIYIYNIKCSTLFLSPCYCPLIAYRLPLMPICLGIMYMGPSPSPEEHTGYVRLLGLGARTPDQIHYG